MKKFCHSLLTEYSDKNSKPLESYTPGSKYKAWWKCSQCGLEWQSRIGHRTKGAGCRRCGLNRGHLLRAKQKQSIFSTHSIIASEWADSTDICLVSAGCNKAYKWRCNKCDRIFLSSPNRRCNQGSGCPYCSGRLATEENCLLNLRPDIAEELHSDIDPSSICCYSNKVLQWKCLVCGHQWLSTVNNRTKGRGCPKCAKKNSKPQRTIATILNNQKMSFRQEFRIDDCRDKRTLPFDFALFANLKLFGLVEYQGEQHFFPIWGNKALEITKVHDRIKKEYCAVNNIPFLVIHYWDRQKINEVITEFINKIESTL